MCERYIDMGLFNKNKLSEEDEIEQILADNNVFEGIECEVEFPDQQLKIGTKSGLTKGAATLAFGLVGLAATTGIKQSEEKRKIETIFQIVDKGIVFKQAKMNGEDLRIPYDNIINANSINENSFIIKLLKNQDITITRVITAKMIINMPLKIHLINHIVNVINERADGLQYEEAGWGLEHGTKPTETKQKSNSLIDELERLGNMYEKGLLTDEEFKLAKSKLLEEK